MNELYFSIGEMPAVLYGDKSDSLYFFVHGKHGHKEEARALAEVVCPRGWQVLGVDLPGHGSRQGEKDACVPWRVVPELQAALASLREHWRQIALQANSIGAWFSLLAFPDERLEKCLFVSPVVDMVQLIQRMMQWESISQETLERLGSVKTSFGETLSWQYYQYAIAHPIARWHSPTAVLYPEWDNLTPRQEVEAFAQRFSWDLSVAAEGEHWFHTPEQREVLARWLMAYGPLPPEEALFFQGRREELVLYAVFRSRLLFQVGAAGIKVQKSQITFSGKYGFAFVSHPRRKWDRGILVSFGLFYRQASPRIRYAVEPYPGRWTHHLLVQRKEEIDDELMGWLTEARWFADAK